MVEGIFDSLSSALVSFCVTVLELFPDSPFLFLDNMGAPPYVIMGYVNWFIDFGTIINISLGWAACILLWYGYQIVLRWVKVIE